MRRNSGAMHSYSIEHPSNIEHTTQNNGNNFLIGSEVNRLHIKHIAKLLASSHIRTTHTHTHSKILLGISNYYLCGTVDAWVSAEDFYFGIARKTESLYNPLSRRLMSTIKRITRVSSPPHKYNQT